VVVPLEQRDVDQEAIAAAVSTAEQRLVLALAAIHAARPLAIRSLRLDDLDLGNRRMTSGRVHPPAGRTHLPRPARLPHLPAGALAQHRQPARAHHPAHRQRDRADQPRPLR